MATAPTSGNAALSKRLLVRRLGLVDYVPTWEAMRDFTTARTEATPSEVWIVEHRPVFTQGQAGRPEHVLAAGDIPIVHTDRGGQVTYHGPGQAVFYLLLSLRETGLGVRGLVSAIEDTVIALLAAHGVQAQARRDAPGVYVADRKIASLGLRVRRGCTYHGLALNVCNDLAPFARINPCGHAGLEVTSTGQLGIDATPEQISSEWIRRFAGALGYEPEEVSR